MWKTKRWNTGILYQYFSRQENPKKSWARKPHSNSLWQAFKYCSVSSVVVASAGGGSWWIYNYNSPNTWSCYIFFTGKTFNFIHVSLIQCTCFKRGTILQFSPDSFTLIHVNNGVPPRITLSVPCLKSFVTPLLEEKRIKHGQILWTVI